MGTIANLAVALTANIGGFNSPMIVAGKTVGALRTGFAAATNSANAFERAMLSAGKVKIAGAESVASLRAALTTARAELNKFANHHDVAVMIEVSREFLDESYIKARSSLNSLIKKSGLKVAAAVVSDKTKSARAWLSRQRQAMAKPIVAYISARADQFNAIYEPLRLKIEGLRRFRVIRIALAATDAISPISRAALSTLQPLLRLAGHGIMVAVHLSHAGIAAGVNKAGEALKGLVGVASGVASKIASAFTGVGAILAAVAGGVGLVTLVKDSMEAVAATGRLSDRLGIATEKLGGMQYAAKLAGVDSDGLTESLGHMLKNLSEADDKGGPAADAIALMGLNAKKLKDESPDQAFAQIADGLKSIQNPADRGRAAMELFGKSGQQLLPLLLQGSKGIAAAQAEADKLGITFNRVDAAKVELANQSFVRLQAVLTGAAQMLAIKLAPFIEAATNKLVAMATSGRGAGAVVVDAFEWVVKAVAVASDYLQLLPIGFHGFRAIALIAISDVLGAIDNLGSGLVKLLNLLPGVKLSWTDTFSALRDGMDQIATEEAGKLNDALGAFQRGDNAKAAGKLFDGIRAAADASAKSVADNAKNMNDASDATDKFGANLEKTKEDAKKIADTLAELDKSLATFGQTEGQKKIFDLKELGASPEQLAQAQARIDSLSKLENAKKGADAIASLQKEIDQFGMSDSQKKLADLKLPGIDQSTLDKMKSMADRLDALKEANQVFTETRTPMEQYESKIGKLSDLLNSGAVDWDTYGRAVRAAREQLEKATQVNPQQLLASGSAAAQQFEYTIKHQAAFDNTLGAQKANPQNNKDEVAKLQLTETQQSRRVLERIENKLTDSTADATQVVQI
jgi:hypothetical protein